jgi:hypothetical protein
MGIRGAVNVRDLKVSRAWERGLSRKTSEGAPETTVRDVECQEY